MKYSDGSINDYWLCKDASANKKLLASAAPSLQLVNAEKTDDKTYRFTIRNKGNKPALYIKLNLRNKDGKALLPVFFSDGYFHILPGESQEIELDLSLAPACDDPYLTYDFHAGEKVFLGTL